MHPFETREDHVAILWNAVKPNLFRPVHESLSEVFGKAGIKVRDFYASTDEDTVRRAETAIFVKRILEEPSLVAVIGCFLDIEDEDVRKLLAAGKPVAFVDRPRTGKGGGHVHFDHAGGARQVVKALRELGRSRFGWIGPVEETGWAGGQRFTAIRTVLEREHLKLATAHTLTYDLDAGAETAERLLMSAGTDLDAIVFASDIQAIGGMRAISSLGFDIPGRICVAAFDDTEAARNSDPALSSVRQPFAEAGRRAAQMVVASLGGDLAALQEVRLPEQFVLRGSCIEGIESERVYDPEKGIVESRA